MKFLEKITPRDYQESILKACIEKNCLVVLPTGLGKTLIALMLSIKRMESFPSEKVVFLAPTRPLVEQHLNFFKKHLPELFGEMQLFTGQIPPEKRKTVWRTADIIFSTPQCVANDLKNNLYSLEEVCLLIQDEAHRCIRNYDYTYIAKKYLEQSTNPRIVGLTASPGSERVKIKEICNNLHIEAVELRTRESSDVKDYLQELKFEKIILEVSPEMEQIRGALNRLFQEYVSELRNRKIFFGRPTKTELIKLQKKIMLNISKGKKDYNTLLASSACAQSIKIQHALELLETQTIWSFNNYLTVLLKKALKKENKGVIRLASKPEFNYSLAKSKDLLRNGIEHPKVLKIQDLVKKEKELNDKGKIIIFAQFRDTAKMISEKLKEIPGISPEVFIGQGKKIDSDGGTIKGLNQKEQKEIIENFSSGKTNVLCATSIGEEGLDIPEVNTVIFYEPVPSAIRAIQRAGRTARLMKGKLIILITKNTRDEAYFYVSKFKEKKMHNAISSIKEGLAKKTKTEKQRTLE
ncbi:DEAD/DEAH box helicase family protein [Patescibacteria group bacterium]|nr:DEAD/DEAH box helicase family protein [Patescibacteria group bacterium]